MAGNEQILNTITSDKFLYSLPKEKLKKIIKAASNVRKKKYREIKVPKYRTPGAKAMSLEDVDRFFSAFKPEEYRYEILFKVQAMLGLRIGEVVGINQKDIDFQNKQIKIRTEKQGPYAVTDMMYMHEKLEPMLFEYMQIYEDEIKAHSGYIFFAETTTCRFSHISSDRARNVFRRVCNRAGLTQTYGEREGISGLDNWKHGKLYKYTTHSLRHSFGKFLAKRHIPIEIAKHLMRHHKIDTTQIYYVPDKEDIDTRLRDLFAQAAVSR